jgi:outer membrane protein assembly factor BamB
MWGLDMDAGHSRWATPVGNLFHYNPVSVANGVAYTVTGLGTLVGVETDTGIPVLQRSIALDTATPMAEMNSSGVAIARSTLYAMAGDWLVAYR